MKPAIPDSLRPDRVLDPDHSPSRLTRFARIWLAGLAILVGAFVLPSLAGASVAQEEQAGSRILGELGGGELRCAEASASDLDQIGEYVMGRMFESPQGHEAMNRLMSSMMGESGEQSMHEAMGRRFAGCGGGHLPAGFGRMMGAINAMGMMSGAGPGRGSYGGLGSMMGGWGDQNDAGGPSTAVIVALVVVVAAAALAFAWFGLRRRPGDPLDVLNRRYAAGELSTEEYQLRRGELR